MSRTQQSGGGPDRTPAERPAARGGSSWLRVLGVLVVAGALVGGATLLPRTVNWSATEAETTSAAKEAPLQNVTLACPESRYDKGTATTDVAAVSVPRELSAKLTPPGKSELTWTGLGRSGVLDSVAERQRLALHPVRGDKTPPMLAQASGKLAPGASAGQITRATEGELRGLAETPCVRPATEFWFVGTGSSIGRHGQIFLTNVDAAPARVDLQIHDEKGRVRPEDTRGLLVQPFSQRVVRLDELAPGSERVTVGVRAAEGRVAAALRDDLTDDGVVRGVDWVPDSRAPARDVVVPGVAPGPGKRVLTIAAPGDSSALVKLSLLGPNSTFTPNQDSTVEVPPGTVREVSLEKFTSAEAAAVRIKSDIPVVAGLRSEIGTSDSGADSDDPSSDDSVAPSDLVHTAGSVPLSGPAVVPLTQVRKNTASSLLLTAGGTGTSSATVTVLGDDGEKLSSKEVKVAAGRTVEHPIPPPSGVKQYSVLVEPAKGAELYGSRLFQEEADDGGPLVSSWMLSEAPTTFVRPAVRPDPAGGL